MQTVIFAMQENYIIFSDVDVDYFKSIITKAKELTKGLSLQIPQQNGSRSADYSCGFALDTLSSHLRKFINDSPTLTQLPIYRNCLALNSYILATLALLDENKKESFLVNEVASYLSLLGNILQLNVLCIMDDENSENYRKTMQALQNGMEVLECHYLFENQGNTFFLELYLRFANNFLTLQGNFYLGNKQFQHASLQELCTYIKEDAKKRAKINSIDNISILYHPNTVLCKISDGEIDKKIASKISDLTKSAYSIRQQFLVYYNQPWGNIDLVDVYFDTHLKKIFILNVNSSCHSSHHSFLFELTSHLEERGFPFVILACQTKFQKESLYPDSAFYSYLLSTLTARIPFHEFWQPHHFTSPPPFLCLHSSRHTSGS